MILLSQRSWDVHSFYFIQRVISKQSACLVFIIGQNLTSAGGMVERSYSSSMKMRRCARSFSHTEGCICISICICNCVGNFYLSASGAGGRKRLLLEEDARSFSHTGRGTAPARLSH